MSGSIMMTHKSRGEEVRVRENTKKTFMASHIWFSCAGLRAGVTTWDAKTLEQVGHSKTCNI